MAQPRRQKKGMCLLCGKVEKLRKSHIIPRWMVDSIGAGTDDLIELREHINVKTTKSLLFNSWKTTDNLLCERCEGILCKWETNIKETLFIKQSKGSDLKWNPQGKYCLHLGGKISGWLLNSTTEFHLGVTSIAARVCSTASNFDFVVTDDFTEHLWNCVRSKTLSNRLNYLVIKLEGLGSDAGIGSKPGKSIRGDNAIFEMITAGCLWAFFDANGLINDFYKEGFYIPAVEWNYIINSQLTLNEVME
jgi:hypothetical protein